MTDNTPEQTPETPAADEQGKPAETDDTSPDLGDAGKQALDRMKTERNEAKKAAAAAQREIETLRKQSMSESEKAVTEAEERGKNTATQEFGKRLAKSEVRTLAAEADADLSGVFDYLDLSRFVGDDGEPDTKAIETFVGGLPKKTPGTPSFNGGPRTPAAPQRAGTLGEAISAKYAAGTNR